MYRLYKYIAQNNTAVKILKKLVPVFYGFCYKLVSKNYQQ